MISLKKNQTKRLPEISTASLPDIVFILLFFFMTVATIKNQASLIQPQLPNANESERYDSTSDVIDIKVGFSSEITRNTNKEDILIQIGERLVPLNEVCHYALQELAQISEHLQDGVTVAIKADSNVDMGTVAQIKSQLKEVNLLQLSYTTLEGNVVLQE
ncbi:MAG: biopolymer transporter ExbD [Bacteroidota bacterium]